MACGDPDAEIALGNALSEAGRTEEAIARYRAALAIRPGHGPTHYNLGNAYLRLERPELAEPCYREAVRLDPGCAGAHNNLGNVLRGLGRPAEAVACYRDALRLRPESAGAQTNLGATLIALRRPEEALVPLREAVRLDPTYAEACNNLGGALLALDRPEEALGWFNQARLLDPELSQAELGAAMALLALGRLEEGFAAYEARWRDPAFTADEPVREAPLWDGRADPAGRTILLHAEQGLGDTIQFVRYAKLLRERGATVLLEVQAPLLRLCRPFADTVFARGDAAPGHDLRCPLLSLPRAFDTTLATVPAEVPYLFAPTLRTSWPGVTRPSRASTDIGSAAGDHRVRPGDDGQGGDSRQALGCHIGLVVSGAADHPEDDLRSVPAAFWTPVLALPATFHLLQPEIRAADEAALAGARRHSLPDFAATAAIVAALDVVVAVDTAVAHLAGAMGRPVLLILQHSADFRWLRGRDDSPWYPTMRLFRRGPEDDWPAVLARVATALAAYVQPPSTTKV